MSKTRQALDQQIKAMLARAEKEKRDLTPEEAALYDAMHDHDLELKNDEQNSVRNAGNLTLEACS